MEFTRFVRKPFAVEATEVTVDNIAEVAELTGSLRHKDNGTPYIVVDRRLIPNLYHIYPGFWLTRMGDNNVRCYSKRVFKQQFVETTPDIESWVSYLGEHHRDDVNVRDHNDDGQDVNNDDAAQDVNELEPEVDAQDVNTIDA